MKLTQKEKQVLTLLDDAKVEGFEEFVQKFIDLSKAEIQKMVNKFKDLELIEIISLSNDKDLWYFHTGKVNKGMLDDDLRYKRDYGSDSPILTSSKKLEKKVKPE